MEKVKVAVLWSGGKDSSLACYRALQNDLEVAILVAFLWEKPSLAHPLSLVKLQSEAIQIPLHESKVGKPYFEQYRETIVRLKKNFGVEGVVTGDISYVDSFHGNWIDDVCKGTGVKVIKPLWGIDRALILKSLVSEGFKAMFTCVKKPWFNEEWIGRMLDEESMEDLKKLCEELGMDLCGEMGEFHTMMLDAPFFKHRIRILEYNIERNNGVFYLEPTRSSLEPK
ncbi:diphthine--ammonia ligase [Candidatus Bathyarchaeota archaeon]|nr:diphthine--ammonia ligase [Candidatus Bathyarchaeota archaeon]